MTKKYLRIDGIQIGSVPLTATGNVINTGGPVDLSNSTIAWTSVTDRPTAVSAFTNDSNFANVSYVDNSISNLVSSAPETLNTLNELALALNSDANFSTSITTLIGTKANTSSLANVAFSGNYSALANKPTLVQSLAIAGANLQVTFTDATTNDLGSVLGYTGSKGDIGYTGSKGDIGYTGSQGLTGATGPTGYTGSEGAFGATGATGPTGYAGSQGDIGYTGSEGAVGATGPQGIQGNVGYTGSEGIQGVQGYTGSQGDTGATGPQGIQGNIGYTGSEGIQGVQGYTGSQGLTGATGPQGTSGSAGAPGADSIIYTFESLTTDSNPTVGFARLNNNDRSLVTQAYVSKVSNSGANSVPWLNSLVASTNSPNKSIITFGRTNDFAYNYARYYVTGLTDATGYVKLSLTYIDHIGTLNTNGANLLLGASRIGDTGATGPQGNVGYTGSEGAVGATGLTGYVGSEGAVGATGPIGYTGSQGLTGATGLTGPNGDTGATGPQGNIGYTGSEGTIGYTGSAGTNGADGYTGSQGIAGYTGSIGATGTIGYTGSQGNIGYSGSQGISGYTGSKGDTGLGFNIAKTYASVAALTADTSPTGIVSGEFALINTGNVEDPDNSKLYLWNGSTYSYVNDLSGAAGITGPQGSTGYTGSAGTTGYVGSQGTTGYTGSIGANGEIGYTGSHGDLGYTGSVGSTGNVGYTGSQGTLGYTGSQGDTGLTGYTGSTGATGYTGSEGVVGATGPIGYTGSEGIQGATGLTGATGPQGIQGNVGYTGSQGTIGYTGSEGLIPGTANQIIYRNSSNVATGSSGLTYDGVSIKVNGNLESVYQNGNEGGEIFLSNAATNTTLVNGVTIDIHQNRLRFFEQGGNNRGGYIDISSLSNTVGTLLSVFRTTAPSTNKGATGDTKGHYAVSGDNLYVCNTDYTDGSANIWVKITGTSSW